MQNLETYGLPAAVDLEKIIIGLVLQNCEKYYPQVADVVSGADFSISKHRVAWESIAELRAAGKGVDYVTVYRKLEEKHAIDPELLSYLVSLTNGVPEIPNPGTYAAAVREKSTLRQAILACQSTINRLCDPRASADDVVAAEKVIRRISESQTKKRRLKSASDVIKGGDPSEEKASAAAFLEPPMGGGGVTTPWAWLNAITGGLKAGNLIILAARPAVGKTSAASQIGMHLLDLDMGMVFVSLEMSATDILRKMVAAKAGVSLTEWLGGTISPAERRQVARFSSWMTKKEIYFDDEPRATVPGIHATVLRHMADHEVRMVIVDYLQLLTAAGRGSTRTEDVSEITRDLKLMAMELGVPVIALSQLSRASVKENRRPRLDDLRDSGSIEQDADIVLFLHRVERPFVELILAKQRLGAIGEVKLAFDRKTGLFSETEGAARE